VENNKVKDEGKLHRTKNWLKEGFIAFFSTFVFSMKKLGGKLKEKAAGKIESRRPLYAVVFSFLISFR
jgi:hypothetical protein